MAQQVDTQNSTHVLDQDVGCPGCGYNLRGLGSDLVDCPECGLKNDVAVLLVRRWDKPWYRAPRYNTVCLPAAMVLLTALGWVAAMTGLGPWVHGSTWSISMFCVLTGMVLWSCAMALVWNTMDGLNSAGFALLAHVPIVGYLVSLVAFISGLVATIDWFVEYHDGISPKDFPDLIIGVLLFLGGIGVFVLARWIERLVAGHCIRLYLRRPTTSG